MILQVSSCKFAVGVGSTPSGGAGGGKPPKGPGC
ncbi:hypothetical protein BT93_L0491 [Corymbia citriodora subsp. variegata]|uniref:Uncharacterized protein n=1 Tax=Corymbia citriodora subsp. variegata TaxID=360336 RepID=A0A8T0CTX8_CORYI|nr:hypothetical protein BT93_L0491 [Corymbia citriodora subsp. variegata]